MSRKHGGRIGPVLWASAALGGLAGLLLYPCIQYSVEIAQILAGSVELPEGDFKRVNARAAYSIVVSLPALLLSAGVSERSLHLLLSAISGALSFASVSACSLVFCRSRVLALLLPFVFLCLAAVGHRYPVLFGVSVNNSGAIGLSAVVLVMGLFFLDLRRASAFLLGVLPCVHASLALAAWIVVGTTLVFEGWTGLRERRRELLPFALGLALAFGGLAVQRLLLPLPELPVDASFETLVRSVMSTWDGHRAPIRDAAQLRSMLEVDAYVLASALVFGFARARVPQPAVRFARGLAGLVLVSIAVCALEELHPERIPLTVRALMIGRWLNLTSILFPVLVLGTLGHLALERGSPLAGAAIVALLAFAAWATPLPTTTLLDGPLALTSIADPGEFFLEVGEGSFQFLAFHAAVVSDADYLLSTFHARGLAFPLAWALGMALLAFGRRDGSAFAGRTWRDPARLTAIGLAALLAGHAAWRLYEAATLGRTDRLLAYVAFVTEGGAPLQAAVRSGEGLLVIPPDFVQFPQLHTGRGLLLDIDEIDVLPYVPRAAPRAARILRDVYGTRLAEPRPKRFTRRVRRIWERRSQQDWAAIRRNYGATEVIVPAEWRPDLPLVARDDRWALYRIPERT